MFSKLFKDKSPHAQKILLGIGHSHILSIRYAVNSVLDELAANNLALDTIWLGEKPYIDYQARAENKDIKNFTFSNPLLSEIEKLNPSKDIIFSSYGGNAHNILGLVQHPTPFDFIYAGIQSEGEEGAEIVPSKLVEAAIIQQGGFPETCWALRATRAAFGGRIIQCESPPPIIDSNFLMENAGPFKASFIKFGISKPALRLKLWRMHSDLVKKECKELDIEFLPAPTEFITADGYLTDSGLNNDTTHANAIYGGAVIRQLISASSSKLQMELDDASL